MPRTKQTSKRRRLKQTAATVGAFGVSLSLAGGPSAAAVMLETDIPFSMTALGHESTLTEEEIFDVSLRTFHVFDKENYERHAVVRYPRSCTCCKSWGACYWNCVANKSQTTGTTVKTPAATPAPQKSRK